MASWVSARLKTTTTTTTPAKKQKADDGSSSNNSEANPNAKRKVALLVAYNGAKYSGLQKNPHVSTIEEALEAAIHRAGGISDDNVGVLQKISWSRAGRTDKGVHALGQIITVKLVLTPDGLLERVNWQLEGSDISVLGMERANNNLCAHVACSSREYEYLLPTSALRPESSGGDGDAAAAAGDADEREDGSVRAATAAPAGRPHMSMSGPLSDEERSRLASLFKRYEGTHSFHNFTDGKLTHEDKSARRYMMSLTVGEPLELSGVEYVSLRLHGQSFLMHQIRKMVGLLVAVFRGDVPEEAMKAALVRPRVAGIPMAPSCALTLRRCLYAEYERRRPADRNSIHFPGCEDAKRAFLLARILPHVAECEANGEYIRFTRALQAWAADWQGSCKSAKQAAAANAAAASTLPAAVSGAESGTATA